MTDAIEPLHVEIGKPPFPIHQLVLFASADAYAVSEGVRLMRTKGLGEYRRRENDLWRWMQKWEQSSARVLHEVKYAIECGRHKLYEPELHDIRRIVAQMRAMTVDNLHHQRGGPLTRDRLHLLSGRMPDELAAHAQRLHQIQRTMPDDLVIDAVSRSAEFDSMDDKGSSALVRTIREFRTDFRATQKSGAGVRMRLIHIADDCAGFEHGEEALPSARMVLGQQRAGRNSETGMARIVVLWSQDDDRSKFEEACHRLIGLAKRAGATVRAMGVPSEQWAFSTDDECWWNCLFEAAWSETHPTLRAPKHVWINSQDNSLGLVLAPYDTEKLRRLRETYLSWFIIPPDWLTRLPDAYCADFEDVAWACMAFCELLEAKALPSHGAGKDRKRRIIAATIAAKRYSVTKKTIYEAVKDGKLVDHRPAGHAPNAILLVDEDEVAAHWSPRTT